MSSLRETILGATLEAMDHGSVRYDPAVVPSGVGLIDATLREGRGVLLVGTHANGSLSRLALRAFYDSKVHFTAVAITDLYPVSGTTVAVPAIRPERNFLVAVRTKLRRGELVCAMLDAYEPTTQRPIELRATTGSVWISDSLLRLALACNAAIVFVAARLDEDGTVALTFHAVPDDTDPDRSRIEFVSYSERHIASAAERRIASME